MQLISDSRIGSNVRAVLTLSIACGMSRKEIVSYPIMKRILLLCLGATAFTAYVCAGTPERAPVRIPGTSCQLLVVTTATWDTCVGTLRRFARTDSTASWQMVGSEVRVVVGHQGLGAAPGWLPVKRGTPVKHEGDGRAPAGVFRLGPAFGYADPSEVQGLHMQYLHATDALKCIDDPRSAYYNRMIDSTGVHADWQSRESMKIASDEYRLGIVIRYNSDPVIPGNGSCIFLHIWGSPDEGTAGCTAMSADDLAIVLHWLDAALDPVLLQCPAGILNGTSSAPAFP